MNRALIGKELRESRWKLVVGTVVLTLFAVALVLLYDLLKGMMLQVPPGFDWARDFIRIDLLDDFNYYLWSQWHAKNLYQFGTVLAVLVGMSSVAGEVNSHTISFLLARPISRRTVFANKVIAGVITLGVAVAVSTGLMLIVSMASTEQVIDVGRLTVATLITFIGLILIYMLSVFFSTLIDEPVKAGGITVLTLLLMSVLGWFGATRQYSLFTHINGGEYFIRGTFPFVSLGAMILTTLGLLFAGVTLLEKKEF